MKKVSLTIDGKSITAPVGLNVLGAALNNGVYIPNLCRLPDNPEPPASCRLCFVEIEGYPKPVTACTEVVREGLVVNSRGPNALRLARTGLELLLASHPIECARCPINRACELQKIAAHVGIRLKTKRLRKFVKDIPTDESSPLFVYDARKCVLCGRCVWVCRERLGIGAIGFAQRGFNRLVTTFGDGPVGASGCRNCGECVITCPSGAFTFKRRSETVHG